MQFYKLAERGEAEVINNLCMLKMYFTIFKNKHIYVTVWLNFFSQNSQLEEAIAELIVHLKLVCRRYWRDALASVALTKHERPLRSSMHS